MSKRKKRKRKRNLQKLGERRELTTKQRWGFAALLLCGMAVILGPYIMGFVAFPDLWHRIRLTIGIGIAGACSFLA